MKHKHDDLIGFLADTWWYGLTRRLPEQKFKALAKLRARQGFTAVQIVVGIPPEVGPCNENARSQVGFPWTLPEFSPAVEMKTSVKKQAKFNRDYLIFAKNRIKILNNLGLTAIVYGAWGHQIAWLGTDAMIEWWLEIIKALDKLDVVYCLCGESNLWVGKEGQLLPDKSTDMLVNNRSLASRLPARVRRLLSQAVRRLNTQLTKRQYQKRRQAWSMTLAQVSKHTEKPFIIHTLPNETGYEAVTNTELLAANTVQTGHSPAAKNRLWQLPLALSKRDPRQRAYINLEPWYEGIRDQFWVQDQMFAYWASMLAGAISHCYGAHGIWNVGDGTFLAHWGKQTFEQAMALDTPRLLGLSHKLYTTHRAEGAQVFYECNGDELRTIGQKREERLIQYFPDVTTIDNVPNGRIWLPLEGVFTDTLPSKGQVVIVKE